MNDTTRPALAASTALSRPAEPARSMIDLVLEHAAARAGTSNSRDDWDPDVDPEWVRYNAAVEAISETPCTSIADMLAKLQAARLEASSGDAASVPPERRTPEKEQIANCPAGAWAWEICMDLQRLFGGTALAAAPSPGLAGAEDAELIALLDQRNALARKYRRLWRAFKGEDVAAEEAYQQKVTDPVMRQIHAIDGRLKKMRAQTPQGLLARVEAMVIEEPNAGVPEASAIPDDMMRAIVLDMRNIKRQRTKGEQPSPDAELIRLCDELVAAEAAFEASDEIGKENGPLWAEVQDIERRLDGMQAATLGGVLAMARVAKHQAIQPDGDLIYSDSTCGQWPELVIEGLLRVAGQGASVPAPSPDADVISASTELSAAVAAWYGTDEPGAPERYAAGQARYLAALDALRAAPAPRTLPGFQAMAKAVLADMTGPDGKVTVQTLQASEITQEMILTLLTGLRGNGGPAS